MELYLSKSNLILNRCQSNRIKRAKFRWSDGWKCPRPNARYHHHDYQSFRLQRGYVNKREKGLHHRYLWKERRKKRKNDEDQQQWQMNDCTEMLRLIECWLKCLALTWSGGSRQCLKQHREIETHSFVSLAHFLLDLSRQKMKAIENIYTYLYQRKNSVTFLIPSRLVSK